MCKVMITITTADDKPQRVWVTLPDTAGTFHVLVEGGDHVSNYTFHGDGRPVSKFQALSFPHQRWHVRPARSVSPLGA